jgi:hypothetical protein
MALKIPAGVDVPGKIDRGMTRSPAFERWFGKSKVVDTKGQPLVVYHGTKAPRFNVFKQSANIEQQNLGFHFGTKAQALHRFAGAGDEELGLTDVYYVLGSSVLQRTVPAFPRIMAFYLSVQNPLRMPDLGGWEPEAVAEELVRQGLSSPSLVKRVGQAYRSGDDTDVGELLATQRAYALLHDELRRLGVDGIVYANKIEGKGDSWMVFRPEQVKSATDNLGTYSPDDPDFRANPQRRLL